MVDVANDDQISIVRHIPLPVPSAGILPGHLFDVVHPADDRPPVRVGSKHRRVQGLVHQSLRIIFGAHAPFLDDHLVLGGEIRGSQAQVGHAVGLEFHHFWQGLFRHNLEIGRVVLVGEGIVATAGLGDNPVEGVARNLLGAFEHHMFEHVGNTGSAVLFVDGANAIPDHVHHGRCAMIFLDHHGHAIGKLLLEGIGRRRSVCQRGQRQQGRNQTQSAHVSVRASVRMIFPDRRSYPGSAYDIQSHVWFPEERLDAIRRR